MRKKHKLFILISIHAPRMGSDAFALGFERFKKFQSTLPAWGATIFTSVGS